MGTFYCGSCGEHKRDDLLCRITSSGRKVCVSCEARRQKRDADREKVLFVGNNGAVVKGTNHEKAVKRKRAKRYREGKLPFFTT